MTPPSIRLYEDSCECSAVYTIRPDGTLAYVRGSAATCPPCRARGYVYLSGEAPTVPKPEKES